MPNFNEAKEKAATLAQKEMEGYEKKLKSLTVDQFASFDFPDIEFEKEKERLIKLKEDVSARVDKLLK